MAEQADQLAPRPHIAIIPSSGLGHLIPLLEFAKKLALHHTNISITLFILTISPGQPPAQKSLLQSALPDHINVIHLPQVDLDDIDSSSELVEVKILLAFTKSIPFIGDALRSLATKVKLVAMVVDLFGAEAIVLANELGVSRYICHLSPTTLLPWALRLPEFDRTVKCEFKDMVEPVKLTGSIWVHGKDFPGPLQNRKSKTYEMFLKVANQVRTCDGIILNDFYELQPAAIKAVEGGEFGYPYPPVYPVGPLVSSGLDDRSDHSGCLEWLDRQEPGSVLYVSFGSGGTLSHDQICELALGLEMSKEKFLWVLRAPDEKISSGAYFATENDEHCHFEFLPDGFLERVEGVGLVVSNWAPQARILSHRSVGGFVTHCGWSSVLEAVVNGVGMIAWPLFGEQRLNAVLVVEELRVGLRVEEGVNGVVGREEVVKVVEELMEGKGGMEIRGRIVKLKEAARKAVGPEGSSTRSMSELVQRWKEGGATSRQS